jgi:hypothetical protein
VEIPETQREYYDRILRKKDSEIKILEILVSELAHLWTKSIEEEKPCS